MKKALKAVSVCLISLLVLFAPYQKSVAHAKTDVRWQQHTVVLDHPIADIEKVVLECWNYDKLFPYVTKSTRLSKDQCYVETQIEWAGIKFGTYWMKIRVRKDMTTQDNTVISFVTERMDGNVKHFEAEGMLVKMSDGVTKAVVRIKADPGLPGVPDSIIEDNTNKVVKKFFQNLKKRMDEGSYVNGAFYN